MSNKLRRVGRWLLIILALGLAVWAISRLELPLQAAACWMITLTGLLVWGNWRLNRLLDQRYPWQASVGRRFLIQMFLAILYSLVCINLSYWLFRYLFLGVSPDSHQLLVLNIYGLFFLLAVVSANVVIYIMMQWRKSMVYTESLKQEQVKSHLESLKSHLDPHFLFNNLNILSSLIDLDADRAQDFLASFSEVYRYVLRQRGEELVPLQQELDFLTSYLYMLRQRFPTQIHLDLKIDPEVRQSLIPPLALQLLIENAIKHNKSSDSSPLKIDVWTADQQIHVRNNLQVKTLPPSGAQFGLDNLKKRYEYLADCEIGIERTDSFFHVSLPLISQQQS